MELDASSLRPGALDFPQRNGDQILCFKCTLHPQSGHPFFALGLSNRLFPNWRNSDAFSWDSYQIRVDCVHSAPCLPSKGMDLQLSSFLATPSRTHCPMGGRRCFCYTQISLLASFKMHVGAGKLYFTKYDLLKSQCRQIGDFGVRTKTESNGRWKNKQMRM